MYLFPWKQDIIEPNLTSLKKETAFQFNQVNQTKAKPKQIATYM